MKNLTRASNFSWMVVRSFLGAKRWPSLPRASRSASSSTAPSTPSECRRRRPTSPRTPRRPPGLQKRALKFQSLNSNSRELELTNLLRAHSRLYRNQILQVNTRWKALAEIYTKHSFASFSDLFSLKIAEHFADFENCFQNSIILPEFCWIFVEF